MEWKANLLLKILLMLEGKELVSHLTQILDLPQLPAAFKYLTPPTIPCFLFSPINLYIQRSPSLPQDSFFLCGRLLTALILVFPFPFPLLPLQEFCQTQSRHCWVNPLFSWLVFCETMVAKLLGVASTAVWTCSGSKSSKPMSVYPQERWRNNTGIIQCVKSGFPRQGIQLVQAVAMSPGYAFFQSCRLVFFFVKVGFLGYWDFRALH